MKFEAYTKALSASPQEFGPLMSSVFRDWREDGSFNAKDFQNIIPRWDSRLDAVLYAALTLADEVNPNAYHNQHHNHEVVALTLALIKRHHAMGAKPGMSPEMATITLAAAAIHDYRHDGTGNKMGGEVYPMRLEKAALSAAKPHLIAAGMSETEWLKLSMLVLPTDITPTDKPSPSAQLHEIFGYHSGAQVELHDIDPLFLSLIYDSELALCAQILGDADIGISAGLDMHIAKQNSAQLSVESKGAIPCTPQSLSGFLSYVCKDFPASPSGKSCLTPGFERIKSTAKRDIERGIAYDIG